MTIKLDTLGQNFFLHTGPLQRTIGEDHGENATGKKFLDLITLFL
jgi:hypothetical protein